jgi:HAD superfamily hydrolase (TIGR01490 family)
MAGRQRRVDAQLLPVQDSGEPPTTGSLAIFDLDRTLLPGSSLVALARAMAVARMVPRRRLASAVLQEARYKRRGAHDGEVSALRDEALGHIAGLERVPLVDLAHRVADELVASVTPGARFLLERHLAAGDFVVVLSASPQELVERVAAGLGAHRGIGTRARAVEGVFTGGLEGPFCYGVGKLERLFADIGRVDLTSAFAYADSASDLPLLQACGHPVAINPDRRLRAAATERGWPVLVLSGSASAARPG